MFVHLLQTGQQKHLDVFLSLLSYCRYFSVLSTAGTDEQTRCVGGFLLSDLQFTAERNKQHKEEETS